jgi:hypothetical protein
MLLPIGTAHNAAGAARAGIAAIDGELLLEIDARHPQVTVWPRDQLTAARLFGTPAALWDCQDAGLLDLVDVMRLDDVGTGALRQRAAVGLQAVGASRRSTLAVELLGGTAGGLETAGVDWLGEFASTDAGLLIAVRFGRVATSTQMIAWKGGTVPGAYASWQLTRTGAQLTLVVHDGAASVTLTRTLPKETDRGWHFLAIKSEAGTLSMWGDWTAGAATTSLAALEPNPTNTPLHFGGDATVAAAAAQIALVAAFDEVENLTPVTTGAWWRHGRDPAGLASYSRTGSVSIAVERGDDGGVLLADYSGNQAAIGFDPLIRNGHRAGLWSGGGVALANTITQGSLEQWTPTLATVTVGATDSPHGMRDGITLAVTGGGGYVAKGLTIAAAGGVRLIARARAAAAITLELWQSTGTVLAASTTIALGTSYAEIEWRPAYGFTGSATLRIKAGVGAVGSSIDLDEVQWVPAIATAAVGGYITNGASAVSCGVITALASFDGDLADGELRVEALTAIEPTTLAYAVSLTDTSGQETRAIIRDATSRWLGYVTDTSGVEFDGDDGQIMVETDRHHVDARLGWRATEGVRFRLDPEILAGVAADPSWHTELATWSTVGADAVEVALGRGPGVAQSWRGWISRVRVYRRIRGAFA